jgi:hypothetical protein
LSTLLSDGDAKNALGELKAESYEDIVTEAIKKFGDFNFKVEDSIVISSLTTLEQARQIILGTDKATGSDGPMLDQPEKSRITFKAEDFTSKTIPLSDDVYKTYAITAASTYFKISMYCALNRIQETSIKTFPICILGVALDCMVAGTKSADNSNYDRNVALFKSLQQEKFRVYHYAISDPSADLFDVYDDYFQNQCNAYDLLGDNFDKRDRDHINRFIVAFGTTRE